MFVCRRGGRIEILFAAVHESAFGTQRTNRDCPLCFRFRRRTGHVEGAVVAGGKPVSSLAVSLIAFAVIFGGAFLGVFLRRALPGHLISSCSTSSWRGTGRRRGRSAI